MCMYTVNKKNNYFLTLKAIDCKDKLSKGKSSYFSFKNNNLIYMTLKKGEFCGVKFEATLRNIFSMEKESINIDLESFFRLLDKVNHEAIVLSLLSLNELICTTPFSCKTSKKEITSHNFQINQPNTISKIKNIVAAENFTRKLQLMPANMLNPTEFIKQVKKEFKPFSNIVSINVLNSIALKEKGLNLLSGVGKGSTKENQPALLTISFKKNKKPETALIGKGVTFDTGGISLKPSAFLEGMQYDMSGAAIVAGTILAFAKNKLTPNFVGVIPLANNDIGNNAFKVSDVLKAYNKKTIEITNTDAEGRLILADAMTYAIKDLHVKKLITIATLTGSVVMALGEEYTGTWATNDKAFKILQESSVISFEQLWRMPFNDIYQKRITQASIIADYINCSKTRSAGAIEAAEFLKLFSENKEYIHLDIAGSNERKFKGATQPIPVLLKTLYCYLQK